LQRNIHIFVHKRIQKCHCNKQTGSVTYLSHTIKHQHINRLMDQSFSHKHRHSQGVQWEQVHPYGEN